MFKLFNKILHALYVFFNEFIFVGERIRTHYYGEDFTKKDINYIENEFRILHKKEYVATTGSLINFSKLHIAKQYIYLIDHKVVDRINVNSYNLKIIKKRTKLGA